MAAMREDHDPRRSARDAGHAGQLAPSGTSANRRAAPAAARTASRPAARPSSVSMRRSRLRREQAGAAGQNSTAAIRM